MTLNEKLRYTAYGMGLMLVGVTIILLVGDLPTDDYVDAYVVYNDLVDQTNEFILRQNKALDGWTRLWLNSGSY